MYFDKIHSTHIKMSRINLKPQIFSFGLLIRWVYKRFTKGFFKKKKNMCKNKKEIIELLTFHCVLRLFQHFFFIQILKRDSIFVFYGNW